MRAVSGSRIGSRVERRLTVSLRRASCSLRNSVPSVSEYSSWYSAVAPRGSGLAVWVTISTGSKGCAADQRAEPGNKEARLSASRTTGWRADDTVTEGGVTKAEHFAILKRRRLA